MEVPPLNCVDTCGVWVFTRVCVYVCVCGSARVWPEVGEREGGSGGVLGKVVRHSGLAWWHISFISSLGHNCAAGKIKL